MPEKKEQPNHPHELLSNEYTESDIDLVKVKSAQFNLCDILCLKHPTFFDHIYAKILFIFNSKCQSNEVNFIHMMNVS